MPAQHACRTPHTGCTAAEMTRLHHPTHPSRCLAAPPPPPPRAPAPPPPAAEMHLLAFLFGMSYYVAVPLTLLPPSWLSYANVMAAFKLVGGGLGLPVGGWACGRVAGPASGLRLCVWGGVRGCTAARAGRWRGVWVCRCTADPTAWIQPHGSFFLYGPSMVPPRPLPAVDRRGPPGLPAPRRPPARRLLRAAPGSQARDGGELVGGWWWPATPSARGGRAREGRARVGRAKTGRGVWGGGSARERRARLGQVRSGPDAGQAGGQALAGGERGRTHRRRRQAGLHPGGGPTGRRMQRACGAGELRA